MQFTIRLKPQEGESLSSYLFRCCQKNKITIETLWRIIHIKGTGFNKRIIHSLDMNPYSNFDLQRMSHLTGRPEEELISHTYFWMANKLIHNEDRNKILLKYIDGKGQLHIASRKICISCITEGGGTGHKLIWNVKKVQFCEVHNCRLTDHCGKCMYQFEYSSEFFLEGRCPNCEAILSDELLHNKTYDEMNESNTLMDTWKWLLGNECSIGQEGYSDSQFLGLKLMYALQNSSKNGFSRQQWYMNLRRAVEEGKNSITLTAIFKTVEMTKRPIEDINRIALSKEMIEDVLRYPRPRQIPLGACQTPWCPSYSKNDNMVRANNSYWFGDRQRYNSCSVCTDCYIEYGYSKQTGEWGNVRGTIKLIQEIYRLKKRWISHTDISKRLKTSTSKIIEVLTYLDCYTGTYYYFEPQITADESVKCFQKLLEGKGVLWKRGADMFGWSMPEFFAIYAMREVKSFLYFDSKELRKRGATIKGNTKKIIMQREIQRYLNVSSQQSIEEVAVSLETTKQYLYETGLSKVISSNNLRVKNETRLRERQHLTILAMEFITERQRKFTPWLKSEIYEHLRIRNMELKHKHRELFDYIDQQFYITKQMIEENELTILKAQADKVVGELRNTGKIVLTKKVVCEKMGFTYNKVFNSWPKLLSHISSLVSLES